MNFDMNQGSEGTATFITPDQPSMDLSKRWERKTAGTELTYLDKFIPSSKLDRLILIKTWMCTYCSMTMTPDPLQTKMTFLMDYSVLTSKRKP